MVTFPITLTDPNPVFKVTAFSTFMCYVLLMFMFSEVEYLKYRAFYGQSFYRTLIGNYTQSIEWYHFQ